VWSKRDLSKIGGGGDFDKLLSSVKSPPASVSKGGSPLAGVEVSFDDYDELETAALATLESEEVTTRIYSFSGRVPGKEQVVRVITNCEDVLCGSLTYFERTPKVDYGIDTGKVRAKSKGD